MDPRTLVHRIFDEIVNQGRLDSVDALFAEDFADHGPGVDLHGREEFRASVRQWLGAFSDIHCEVSNIIVEGDLCAWVVRTTGVHTGDTLGFPATGKRIDTLSANMGRFRDGKAVEHWSEQGTMAMLIQLGVLPAPAPVS
jgi:predicted ester cyclase